VRGILKGLQAPDLTSRADLSLGVDHHWRTPAGRPVAANGGTPLLSSDGLGTNTPHTLADEILQLAVEAERLTDRLLFIRFCSRLGGGE